MQGPLPTGSQGLNENNTQTATFQKSNSHASNTTWSKVCCFRGIIASISAGTAIAVAICFTATPLTVISISSLALLPAICAVTACWAVVYPPQNTTKVVNDGNPTASLPPPVHNMGEEKPLPKQNPYQQELDNCQKLEDFSGIGKQELFQHIPKDDSRFQQLIQDFVKREVDLCVFGDNTCTLKAQTCLQFIEKQGLLPEAIGNARLTHEANKKEVAELERARQIFEKDAETFYKQKIEKIKPLLNGEALTISEIGQRIVIKETEKVDLVRQLAKQDHDDAYLYEEHDRLMKVIEGLALKREALTKTVSIFKEKLNKTDQLRKKSEAADMETLELTAKIEAQKTKKGDLEAELKKNNTVDSLAMSLRSEIADITSLDKEYSIAILKGKNLREAYQQNCKDTANAKNNLSELNSEITGLATTIERDKRCLVMNEQKREEADARKHSKEQQINQLEQEISKLKEYKDQYEKITDTYQVMLEHPGKTQTLSSIQSKEAELRATLTERVKSL